MIRYEPNLMEYHRITRSDTIPLQWIDTIEAFHLKHNHPSPNAKDQVCRRHPKYPRQKMYAPVIYRYETWDQLWVDFQREHPSIAVQIRNNNQPNECPRLLRTHAPWNLIKGKDSSCLCINCEGTNAVIRGSKAALKMISQILPQQSDTDDEETDDTTTMSLNGDDSDEDKNEMADNTEPEVDEALQNEPDQSDDDKAADERVIVKLQRIYNVIEKPSKYDMCVTCLPCLTSGKLEDPKFKCVSGNCERCGFDKLWKHGVRARIFVCEYDAAKGEWVHKLNPNSKLASDIWLEMVEWRDYVYKNKPTVATHAMEVARQAAAALPPEEGDLDYEPTKNASARNLVLETIRGTLVDYLDHFERKMSMHIEHRNLVSSEHRSKLQYSRHSRPLSLARDIDFAENGTIENFDKVQSEHWITKQYTLFMSVSSFLKVDIWNKVDGHLSIGAEVTVNGELYVGDERDTITINMESYWAKVTGYVGDNIYQVEDSNGKVHEVHRSLLRSRERHTICCGHVTDDKLHDRLP